MANNISGYTPTVGYVPGMDMNESGYTPTGKNYIPGMGMEESQNTFAAEQPTEQNVPKAPYIPLTTSDEEAPADITENASTQEESIDVISDYDWTSSINKSQMMNKIPFIKLKEYKITADNAINAIASGVFAWGDMQKAGMNALGRSASLMGTGVSDAASSMGLENELEFLKGAKDNKFSKVVTQLGGVLNNSIDKFVQSAKEHAGKVQPTSDFGPEGQHLMDIYGGLYAREATGRSYTLPYYESEYFSTSNSFSETTTIPLIGAAFDKIAKISNLLPALVEPGVYVQRPKYYNFETDGNQFSFSITLYNTITPLAHLKNSKLIQQIILNNLPRRKTKIVVEPPCIYEVLIPGKAFFPYCFITDLRVLHVGTKRLIAGEIVPEAFEVQITIKSLTSDANNFYEKQMQHHGMAFATPEQESSTNNTNQGESSSQRNAIAGEPAQTTATNNTPVVEDRDKVIPLDRSGNATDGSGDSIYNYINKPGASPTFIVPPEQKYMFNKPTPIKQSFGVEG